MNNIYFEFLPYELIDIILFKLDGIDDIENVYKTFTFNYTKYNKFIKLWVNYKLEGNYNFNLLLSLINKDNINWDKLYREFIIIKDLNIDKILPLGTMDRKVFLFYLNKLPINKKHIWDLLFIIILNKCKYLIELLSTNQDFMTFISIDVFKFLAYPESTKNPFALDI
jgi:hypothetical protein